MPPKRGHFSRSRNLEDFNSRFDKNLVQKKIQSLLKKNKKVRVLEIGCGRVGF